MKKCPLPIGFYAVQFRRGRKQLDARTRLGTEPGESRPSSGSARQIVSMPPRTCVCAKWRGAGLKSAGPRGCGRNSPTTIAYISRGRSAGTLPVRTSQSLGPESVRTRETRRGFLSGKFSGRAANCRSPRFKDISYRFFSALGPRKKRKRAAEHIRQLNIRARP